MRGLAITASNILCQQTYRSEVLNNLFFCFLDRFFVSVTQYPGSLKTHMRCPSGSFTRPNPWCMDAYVNCVPPGKENQGQEKHLNHLPFITHWVAMKKTRESIVSSMDHQSVCGTLQWAWVREGVCEDERVVRQADWLDLSSGNHQQLHWKATPSPSYLASHLIHRSSNPVFLSPPCNFLSFSSSVPHQHFNTLSLHFCRAVS